MTSPQNWAEKRDWLKQHFGEVRVEWLAPHRFHASLPDTALKDHRNQYIGQPNVLGKSGEEGIERLFKGVTELEQNTSAHIRLLKTQQDVLVDPHTLCIKPWINVTVSNT